jgi:hypothetical protein
MSKHKTVAFERGTYGWDGRQKAYAARCDTCGAVTFGGFRTKTDAKAALLHTKPTTSEAPKPSR